MKIPWKSLENPLNFDLSPDTCENAHQTPRFFAVKPHLSAAHGDRRCNTDPNAQTTSTGLCGAHRRPRRRRDMWFRSTAASRAEKYLCLRARHEHSTGTVRATWKVKILFKILKIIIFFCLCLNYIVSINPACDIFVTGIILAQSCKYVVPFCNFIARAGWHGISWLCIYFRACQEVFSRKSKNTLLTYARGCI